MADRTFYGAAGNVPYERDISYKFLVDGANPPTLVAGPLNNYIASVVRVSQGLFRITLADPYKSLVSFSTELNCNTAQARWAQPGPSTNFGTSTPPTLDIFILDNSSAVQDPAAANANNFVSGVIVCCDTAAQ